MFFRADQILEIFLDLQFLLCVSITYFLKCTTFFTNYFSNFISSGVLNRLCAQTLLRSQVSSSLRGGGGGVHLEYMFLTDSAFFFFSLVNNISTLETSCFLFLLRVHQTGIKIFQIAKIKKNNTLELDLFKLSQQFVYYGWR